jgi:hypothetical protein
VLDEHVELLERVLVHQKLDALARGQLAALVLRLDARLPAAEPRIWRAAASSFSKMSFIARSNPVPGLTTLSLAREGGNLAGPHPEEAAQRPSRRMARGWWPWFETPRWREALTMRVEEKAMAQTPAGAVEGMPRLLLRLEGAALAAAALYAYHRVGASWWLFAALILVPDVSFVGYLIKHGSARSATTRCTSRWVR